MFHFTIRSGRTMVAATLFGALLAALPLQDARAQQDVSPPKSILAVSGKHGADHGEARITELHDKLHITAAQEELWGKVAQAMRDNSTAMRASMAERSAHMKTMTAVDDLKSFQIIADLHSDGLKQLIPAFEALYAGMTPEQQKHADHVFEKHQHHGRM